MPTDYMKHERLLTIDKLGLQYGSKQVFRDLSLTIDNIVRPGMNQGQVVSLLGPSGIGKTQLFRCIAGLQQPSTGMVGLNGKNLPVRAGQVGVVFQNYPLLEHRTVWSNLTLAAQQAHKGTADIVKLLDTFGLMDKKDLYPAQLSGGQRQRIAIIQQLLCSSHFILMDEPFSGLDVIMKQKTVDLIREVSTVHELNTLIITTHDISTAIAISDTLWVLGREQADDGSWLPGSTCIKSYDLIERDLAWNADVEKHPNFYPLVLEIRELFQRI
ncbi:MAG: ATP-binding cassette domain-containing protein [Pseudomonadota bacterium]